MSNNDRVRLESSGTDDRTELDPRAARALSECMTTLANGPEMYSVTTESGREYAVDVRDGRCTCPDHTYRRGRCKHLWRAAFATGREEIPAWVDRDAVDDQLGIHVDGPEFAGDADEEAPEAVLADGGRLVPEITTHRESYEQGAALFHRCGGCSRESIYGRESIAHRDECPRRER